MDGKDAGTRQGFASVRTELHGKKRLYTKPDYDTSTRMEGPGKGGQGNQGRLERQLQSMNGNVRRSRSNLGTEKASLR